MAIKYKYYVEKHCANKYKLVNRLIIHGCVSSMQVYTSLVFRTASAPTHLAFVGYYGIVSVPDHHTPPPPWAKDGLMLQAFQANRK